MPDGVRHETYLTDYVKNVMNVTNVMKLCGLKAGVSLYRCVNIIHAGFILTLKGEVFSGI